MHPWWRSRAGPRRNRRSVRIVPSWSCPSPLEVAGCLVAVEQIGLDGETISFLATPEDPDVGPRVPVKARLLVVVVEATGQVGGLADVQDLIVVPHLDSSGLPEYKIYRTHWGEDRPPRNVQVVPRVHVKHILPSRTSHYC